MTPRAGFNAHGNPITPSYVAILGADMPWFLKMNFAAHLDKSPTKPFVTCWEQKRNARKRHPNWRSKPSSPTGAGFFPERSGCTSPLLSGAPPATSDDEVLCDVFSLDWNMEGLNEETQTRGME
jgi:hypothetical protein